MNAVGSALLKDLLLFLDFFAFLFYKISTRPEPDSFQLYRHFTANFEPPQLLKPFLPI
jgi:hypothetical protein